MCHPQIAQIFEFNQCSLRNLWTAFVRGELQFVDLGGEDEVALREAIDLVCPDRDLGVSPSKTNIRMMSLFLGQISDSIYELLRLAKVRESITLLQVVIVNNFPTNQLRQELPDLFLVQRWHAAATRHTFFE